VAVACVVLGRRGRDEGALALAIAVSLIAAPLIWMHYYALLIVPLAIAYPRLSTAWALPLLLWFCHTNTGQSGIPPSVSELLIVLGVTAAVITLALRRSAPGRHGLGAVTAANRLEPVRAVMSTPPRPVWDTQG
jgi:hypothetical protein